MTNRKLYLTIRAMVGALLVLILMAPCARVWSQEFHVDAFDGADPKWTVHFPTEGSPATRVVQHRREKGDWKSGNAEVLRLATVEHNQQLWLESPLPPARPFDDLKLQLRVRSNQEGLRLGARLVFFDHRDPRTGKPLTAEVRGDVFRSGGEWQELTCRINSASVEQALRELRAKTALKLNVPGHTYVDRAILYCDLNPGSCEIAINDLKFGPIIAPPEVYQATPTDPSVRQSSSDTTARSRVELRLGQLKVDSKPFFPRMAVWHDGDSVETLKQTGINTVLVPNANDRDLIARLSNAGLHCVAVPPRPTADRATPELSNQILMWYLGAGVTSKRQKDLIAWSRWLRTVDPTRRPLMADVSSSERVFSRHVGLLGISRPVLGTSVSLRDYRGTLRHRRMLAQPGIFSWTRIQTDPPPAQANRTGEPYVVEPEQLRLQAYAALAAGSRGIAFWNKRPLNEERIGDRERRLMIQQLNLEMSLIEPWISSGQLTGNVVCEVGATAGSSGLIGSLSRGFYEDSRRRSNNSMQPTIRKTNVEAAVFNSPFGQLLLPTWYSESAQYVPGELVAENLSLVAHAPQAERRALLVTTTGIRTLKTDIQGGGLRVFLSTADRQTYLDQTAIIVITSRDDVLNELRSKIARMAETSARIWLQIAESKRDRVQATESSIQASDGRTQSVLVSVNQSITASVLAIERSDFHGARRYAQQALRVLRRLQHGRWRDAVRPLASPLSSPHTLAYSTLPDHYRLLSHMQNVEAKRVVRMLPTVQGGDAGSLANSGWSRFVSRSKDIRGNAQFVRGRDRYSLVLSANPRTRVAEPGLFGDPPVRVTSPILQLRRGEIAYVTGRIRVPANIVGSENNAMVYDSINGVGGGVRWRSQTNGWVQFDLLREATDDSPFFLTFLLNGFGQLEIADLEVVVYPTQRPNASLTGFTRPVSAVPRGE